MGACWVISFLDSNSYARLRFDCGWVGGDDIEGRTYVRSFSAAIEYSTLNSTLGH